MNMRTKASSAYICELLMKIQIPRNQIASLSGLTNTYIRDLEQGNIANVPRGKLIAFAVAVNLGLNDTDRLLTVFDRARLSRDDIPLYLEFFNSIRLTTAVYPVQDFFAYELIVCSVEHRPGKLVIVNDRPTISLRAAGHRSYSDQHLSRSHPIYSELIEAIGQVRRENLNNMLSGHVVEHYICKKCLDEYVGSCKDAGEKKWRKKHLSSLLDLYRKHDNLRIKMISTCSSLLFTLKYIDNKGESPGFVCFCARPGHVLQAERMGRLAGFATANTVMVQTFEKEVQGLGKLVMDEYLEKEKMILYLEKLCR